MSQYASSNTTPATSRESRQSFIIAKPAAAAKPARVSAHAAATSAVSSVPANRKSQAIPNHSVVSKPSVTENAAASAATKMHSKPIVQNTETGLQRKPSLTETAASAAAKKHAKKPETKTPNVEAAAAAKTSSQLKDKEAASHHYRAIAFDEDPVDTKLTEAAVKKHNSTEVGFKDTADLIPDAVEFSEDEDTISMNSDSSWKRSRENRPKIGFTLRDLHDEPDKKLSPPSMEVVSEGNDSSVAPSVPGNDSSGVPSVPANDSSAVPGVTANDSLDAPAVPGNDSLAAPVVPGNDSPAAPVATTPASILKKPSVRLGPPEKKGTKKVQTPASPTKPNGTKDYKNMVLKRTPSTSSFEREPASTTSAFKMKSLRDQHPSAGYGGGFSGGANPPIATTTPRHYNSRFADSDSDDDGFMHTSSPQNHRISLRDPAPAPASAPVAAPAPIAVPAAAPAPASAPVAAPDAAPAPAPVAVEHHEEHKRRGLFSKYKSPTAHHTHKEKPAKESKVEAANRASLRPPPASNDKHFGNYEAGGKKKKFGTLRKVFGLNGKA